MPTENNPQKNKKNKKGLLVILIFIIFFGVFFFLAFKLEAELIKLTESLDGKQKKEQSEKQNISFEVAENKKFHAEITNIIGSVAKKITELNEKIEQSNQAKICEEKPSDGAAIITQELQQYSEKEILIAEMFEAVKAELNEKISELETELKSDAEESNLLKIFKNQIKIEKIAENNFSHQEIKSAYEGYLSSADELIKNRDYNLLYIKTQKLQKISKLDILAKFSLKLQSLNKKREKIFNQILNSYIEEAIKK